MTPEVQDMTQSVETPTQPQAETTPASENLIDADAILTAAGVVVEKDPTQPISFVEKPKEEIATLTNEELQQIDEVIEKALKVDDTTRQLQEKEQEANHVKSELDKLSQEVTEYQTAVTSLIDDPNVGAYVLKKLKGEEVPKLIPAEQLPNLVKDALKAIKAMPDLSKATAATVPNVPPEPKSRKQQIVENWSDIAISPRRL